MSPTIQVHKMERELKKAGCDEEFILHDEHQSEKIIWSARPSDIRFVWVYTACLLTFWLIIPIFIAWFIHIHNNSIKYILTNERLRICGGLIFRRIVDLELYRVKDMSILLPIYFRIFGLGTLELRTSDPSTPFILIEAVPNISKLEETVRQYVEKRRDEKRVQEIDQYRFNN